MYSGYVQTLYKLRANNQIKYDRKNNWKFLSIKPFLTESEKSERINKTLRTANKVPMKIIHQSTMVKVCALLLILIFSVIFIVYCYNHWSDTILSVSMSDIFIVGAVIAVGLLSDFLASLINYRAYFRKKIFLIALSLVGFVAANLYLLILNPMYNRAGEIPKEK
jgi:hypothetical protein